MHIVLFILAVGLVLMIGTGLVFVWLVVSIVKMARRPVVRLASGVRGQVGQLIGWRATGKPILMRKCDRTCCGALNAVDAKFCRRCGKVLDRSRGVVKVVASQPMVASVPVRSVASPASRVVQIVPAGSGRQPLKAC